MGDRGGRGARGPGTGGPGAEELVRCGQRMVVVQLDLCLQDVARIPQAAARCLLVVRDLPVARPGRAVAPCVVVSARLAAGA